MTRKLRTSLIILSLISSPLSAQEEALTIQKAIQHLNHSDYDHREAASAFLWQNASVDELSHLTDSDDPEVRFRVNTLIRNIKTGLALDTPQEIIDLVTEFIENPKRRPFIANELINKKQYLPLLTLIGDLDQSPENEVLKNKYSSQYEQAVRYYYKDLKSAKLAIRVLDIAPPTTRHARLWAFIQRQSGRDDAKLKELLSLPEQTPLSIARVSALYRTSGKTKEAMEWAQQHKQDSFLIGQALISGDLEPFIEWFKKSEKTNTYMIDYLSTVSRRVDGQIEETADYVAAMEQLGKKGKTTNAKAILQLTSIGETQKAYQIMPSKAKKIYNNILLSRLDYQEAFRQVGLEFGKPVTQEWIDSNVPESDLDWWITSSNKASQIVHLLQKVGDTESIALFCQSSWEQSEDASESLEILLDLHRKGLARNASMLIAPLPEKVIDKLIQALKGSDERSAYYYNIMDESLPDLSKLEKIETSLSLETGSFSSVTQAENAKKILAAIEKDCLAHPDDEQREAYLFSLYNIMGKSEKVISFIRKSYQQNPSAQGAMQLAKTLFYYDLDQEAGKLILAHHNTKQNNLKNDLEIVAMLKRAKYDKESAELLKEIDKQLFDDPISISILGGSYSEYAQHKTALEMRQRAFLLSSPDEADFRVWGALLSDADTVYAANKEYKKAAVCTEAYLIIRLNELLKSGSISQRLTSQDIVGELEKIRSKADYYWIRHHGTSGNDKAARAFAWHFTRKNEGNASLPDKVYPALRELGYLDILRESAESSLERYRALFKEYPEAYNDMNSAAWIASRAGLMLDEARRYIETALSHAPNSSAYLDTMAEVYFASGNRAKALEFSKRAWKDSFNYNRHDPIIKEQYYHFKNDPLPNQR